MRNYRLSISKFDFLDKNSLKLIIKNPDSIHQILKVLRLNTKSAEDIFFINGIEPLVYKVKPMMFTEEECIFSITEILKSNAELKKNINFLVPIIKPEAFELMIRKLTELGVSRFIPIRFAKSQEPYLKKISTEKFKSRILKIIQEATEQCNGALYPDFQSPTRLDDYIFSKKENLDNSFKVYASERLSEQATISAIKNNSMHFHLLVGPEGGLSEEEVFFLNSNGFQGVSLGPRLLKAETAALSLLTRINPF